MAFKVLFASPAYAPANVYGGPIRSSHFLARELVRLGVNVDVLTTNANGNSVLDVPLEQFIDLDGVRVMYFQAEFLNPFIYSTRQRGALHELVGRYDLVHIQSVFTFNTLWAASSARRKRIPYIISPRGSLVKGLFKQRGAMRKRIWLTLFDRKNIERAAAIHLTTEYERLEMRQLGIFPQREEVIPNGIDYPEVMEDDGQLDQMFPLVWGLEGGDRRIIFLGRINWKKGLDLLIPAFARVLSDYPTAKLFLVGPDADEYLPYILKMAVDAGVSRRIVATGHLDGERKWRLIRSCDLLVLPSYSENFGLAALEGAAMGKPVVVSREVGVADAIAEADAGLVTELSADSIYRAIVRILGDGDESTYMGERGRRLVREHFLWPSVAGKMFDLYRTLICS